MTCWMWMREPLAYQHLTLVFDVSVDLQAAFFEFAVETHHPLDYPKNWTLSVAASAKPGMTTTKSLATCGPFQALAQPYNLTAVYWELGASAAEMPVPETRCLRMQLTARQDPRVALRQLLVRSGPR